jgi:hypothetical protein
LPQADTIDAPVGRQAIFNTKAYFGGAGGFSPVVFVSFDSVVVAVPPGVDVVAFFSVFVLSPQPIMPTAITHTNNKLKKRFIFSIPQVKGLKDQFSIVSR